MSPIIRTTRHIALMTMTVMLVMCLFATGTLAADRETLYSANYCFTAEDFCPADTQLTGIFVTEVPSATVGNLRFGSRMIQPGDVLPTDALSALLFSPTCKDDRAAEFSYLPISDIGVGKVETMKIKISSGKNEAPTAKDGRLETYKNITNTGTLEIADPESDKLQYNLTSSPKRGSVEMNDDGTFTYTPAKNKVGKDSFTYSATDSAGNVSNEATIKIEILKPIDKLTYSDMAGDQDQFTALWMRSNGLFAGESVAGVRCFGPDKPVSRGEFLVMVSKLTGLEPDVAALTSGFADEGDTPQWMRPYIVSALRAGVISGVASDDGLIFRPAANLTNAEAAVMLQNILQLPETKEAAAFAADTTTPAWAQDAVSALYGAGVPVDYNDCMDGTTRRDVANLLYAVSQLREEGDLF